MVENLREERETLQDVPILFEKDGERDKHHVQDIRGRSQSTEHTKVIEIDNRQGMATFQLEIAGYDRLSSRTYTYIGYNWA